MRVAVGSAVGMSAAALGAVVIIGVGVAGLGTLGLWALLEGLPLFYGCTPHDEQLSRQLAREKDLALHPPGAEAHGTPYSGCEEDDRVPYGSQEYHHQLDTRQVMAFYLRSAPRHGWRLAEPDAERPGRDPDHLCFSRSTDGTVKNLEIWAPSETPERFTVSISTRTGDGGRC